MNNIPEPSAEAFTALLKRRAFLALAIFAPLSACVHDSKPYRPVMTLDRVLARMPSLDTEYAVAAAFGPPDFSFRFLQRGDHDPFINEFPRDRWKSSGRHYACEPFRHLASWRRDHRLRFHHRGGAQSVESRTIHLCE